MLVDLRLQLPIHPFDMLILGDILQVIILGLEIPFPQLPVNGLLDDRVVFCHHLVVVLLEEFQFVDELGWVLAGLLELGFEHLDALLALVWDLLEALVDLELHAGGSLILGLFELLLKALFS